MGTAYHPYEILALWVMNTDAFCITIALVDWTLFSSSTVVCIIFRHPLGCKAVLLRAGKHPALTMRKADIKGMGHETRHQHSLSTRIFIISVIVEKKVTSI